jgi:hypothetical protein
MNVIETIKKWQQAFSADFCITDEDVARSEKELEAVLYVFGVLKDKALNKKAKPVPGKFLPGLESARKVELLLSLTQIDSEQIIDAIHNHLVDGMNESTAAAVNQVPKGNLKRNMNTLNDVYKTVGEITEER